MLRGIALLAILILFIRAWYYYRKVAQRRCSEFLEQITIDKSYFDNTIALVLKNKTMDSSNMFLKPGEKVFLIEKCVSLSVYSLNNDIRQTMLESQYKKIDTKLNLHNPTYSYSFESYSIYYRLPSPNENYILKINS